MEIKIGLNCSPCSYMEITDKKKVLVLTISCGGGMGGSKWNLYVEPVSDTALTTEGLIEVTDVFTKETFFVNTRNIVTAYQKKMVEVTSDITAHMNYHNKQCDSYIEKEYFVMGEKDKPVLDKSKYMSRDNLNLVRTEVFKDGKEERYINY